ncbi:hypothetical protein [Paracidovorax wautersii]|nr:hypothetical protein [Paracidovorax wautersii]
MRTANTLQRNFNMLLLLETGKTLHEVAKLGKVQVSTARSSTDRLRGHAIRFVMKYPQVVEGSDSRAKALRAFAKHIGVRVKPSMLRNCKQFDLFDGSSRV